MRLLNISVKEQLLYQLPVKQQSVIWEQKWERLLRCFPMMTEMAHYLCVTGRDEIASLASASSAYLKADAEVEASPELYYDRVIEINLSELEPYINGPFTPDAACPISEFADKGKSKRLSAADGSGIDWVVH